MSTKKNSRCLTAGICVLVAAIASSGAFAEDTWPQFRGPTMNPALEDNPNLPDTWSTTENVEWVTDIPGLGWSSPVVWDNKIFLTTVDAAGNFERPREFHLFALGLQRQYTLPERTRRDLRRGSRPHLQAAPPEQPRGAARKYLESPNT